MFSMPAYLLLNLQSDQIYFELGYQSLIEPFFRFYRNQPIVVFCRSGRRAQLVIDTLIQNKFDQIVDLEGDMLAWKTSGFPVVH
jgi:rhodanese-related sulfurtransferase